MTHYISNVRDIEFNLIELLETAAPDAATVRDLLSELNRTATGMLAEVFADSGQHSPRFDSASHTVTVPEQFAHCYRKFWDAGWWRLFLPDELGGSAIPPSLQWAACELILGANPGILMYLACPPLATIVHRNGTAEQGRWARLMLDRAWGATMVLTEPHAGSDVGAGRTKAIRQPDGSWHLEGVKCFISGGDHDLAENIMHLVLARPSGAGAGAKGLSLFLVPKFHFDSVTGDLGERNGVFATRLENKMGLAASATCELSFGKHGTPATGWLLGEKHDGIRQMFQAVRYARMLVGVKAMATLSTGYLNALSYAKARVQGPDLAVMADPSAPRVPIIRHPEVRRSLMCQKAYAEGLRALCLYAASVQDVLWSSDSSDDALALATRLNELLLPVVKGVGSERAYEQLGCSLQILGGAGYLSDHPIEQYIRDSKIDSLYEGTTAIQSLDFFFRKVIRDDRQAFDHVAAEIMAFSLSESPHLQPERALLQQALGAVQAMLTSMIDNLADEDGVYIAGQHTVRLLMATGDLLIGWLLARQAEVALGKLDTSMSETDRAFYEGKVAVARFFARNVLPELSAGQVIVTAADGSLMDVAETAW